MKFLICLLILFISVLTTLIAITNADGTVRGYFASFDHPLDALSMFTTTADWFVSCLLFTVIVIPFLFLIHVCHSYLQESDQYDYMHYCSEYSGNS